MEYTSHAIGNAALTTGIIGTALGALNGMGGLAGLFGIGANNNTDTGDRPVTRYEMSLIQENNKKDNEIAFLKAQQYTDGLAAGMQAQISQQSVWNATQQGAMVGLQSQISQLQSFTKMMIPDTFIAPSVAATSTTSTGG